MKSSSAKQLLNEVEIAIYDIKQIKGKTPKSESYFARFLVVYIAGVYEEIIEIIINEWATKFSSTTISDFFEKYLDRMFRNPNIDNVKKILGNINPTWAARLESILTQEEKDALNSIVTNKNYLSHGQTCLVTLMEVEQYYFKSKPVLQKIDNIIL